VDRQLPGELRRPLIGVDSFGAQPTLCRHRGLDTIKIYAGEVSARDAVHADGRDRRASRDIDARSFSELTAAGSSEMP